MSQFAQQFGLEFNDPKLLKLALTHRSYLHVTGQGPRDSNERLEFLGDSVLGLVTSEYLYRTHPNEHEGQLTKTKSLLVSKAILSRRALAMGLGRFVLMSHSEVESGGRQRLSILADAFESVIGAIYLDLGFPAARDFIERWLLRDAHLIVADKRHANYKSHLQEYVQSAFRTHPVYRIRSEMGPDHSKSFTVEVMVGRRVLGSGRGKNKKEAEQSAARNALDSVGQPVGEERPPRAPAAPRRSDAETETRRPAAPRGAVEAPAEQTRGPSDRRRRRDRPAAAAADTSSAETERRDLIGRSEPPRREPIERKETIDRNVPAGRTEPVRRIDSPGRGEPIERPRRRPVELEPKPSRLDEDENEEVGRPEGPLEQLHVDLYSWGEGPGAPAVTPPRAAEPRADEESVETARAPVEEEEQATGPPPIERPRRVTGESRDVSYGRRRGRRPPPRPE